MNDLFAIIRETKAFKCEKQNQIGETREMNKVTIRDVAALAGVSISTVSRVFNNNPKVDPVMAEKVRAAAAQINYRPAVVRPAPGERTGRIACIVPALENTYYSSITSGIIDTARKYGQSVIVMTTDSDRDVEEECFRSVTGGAVDGIIFASSNSMDPIARFPALRDIPMVIAARSRLTDGVPHVYADNEEAGYIAAKYLLRLNRRRIALFLSFWDRSIRSAEQFEELHAGGRRGAFTAFERFDGYRRALEEEGVEYDPRMLVFSGYGFEDGYRDAQKLLTGAVDFDAVLTPNDRMAAGVLKLFNEQQLKCPEQISMVCFNGGLLSRVTVPTMTVVRQDNYDLGVKAVEQLNKVIEGEKAENIKLSVSLYIQGSTAQKPEP